MAKQEGDCIACETGVVDFGIGGTEVTGRVEETGPHKERLKEQQRSEPHRAVTEDFVDSRGRSLCPLSLRLLARIVRRR